MTIAQAAHFFESGDLDKAEAECRALLKKMPSHGDALHLLGVILGSRGKIADAAATLEKAVKAAPKNPMVWTNLARMLKEKDAPRAERCLKQALALDPYSVDAMGNLATLYFETKRYDDATKVLETILGYTPNDAQAVRLLARTRRALNDFPRVVELLQALMRLEPNDAKLREFLGETYFLWYDSLDSEPAKALPVVEKWLAFDPESPVARHMHASLSGKDVPKQASAEYIEHHFDAFAGQFDTVLRGLQYRGPEIMRDRVAELYPSPAASLDIVDVGCGTGLFGPLVAPWKRRLVGVDLSGKMLDEAKKLGVYDALERAEITAYLADHPESFDLVVVVDTLVYFGDLTEFVAAAHRSLRPGGYLVGMVEKRAETEAAATFLQTGGRYSHKRSHVEELLVAAGFELAPSTEAVWRTEFGKPVSAVIFGGRRAAS